MGTGCADSNQDSIELLVNSAYPDSLFFLKKIFFLFIIFIPGCAGSSSLPASFLQASHYGGLSCGARAGEQYLRCTGSVLAAHRLQYLWLTGFSTCGSQASVLAAHRLQYLRRTGSVASWQVGSSQTRDWTGVLYTARWTTGPLVTSIASLLRLLSLQSITLLHVWVES